MCLCVASCKTVENVVELIRVCEAEGEHTAICRKREEVPVVLEKVLLHREHFLFSLLIMFHTKDLGKLEALGGMVWYVSA